MSANIYVSLALPFYILVLIVQIVGISVAVSVPFIIVAFNIKRLSGWIKAAWWKFWPVPQPMAVETGLFFSGSILLEIVAGGLLASGAVKPTPRLSRRGSLIPRILRKTKSSTDEEKAIKVVSERK